MTVGATSMYRPAPFRGHDHPSLPVGIWWGSVVVLGDASGGLMTVQIMFGDEEDPISGDLFSLEELSIFASVATTENGELVANGLAPSPDTAFIDRRWGFTLIPQATRVNTYLPNRDLLPIFLGARRGGAASFAALEASIDNQGVGTSFVLTALGYRWEGRSILAPGGVLKPVGVMWSH